MKKRNMIVIGTSAGGLEALQQLVTDLPVDLDAAIFIVWHMAPDVKGLLPKILSRLNRLPAAHAVDQEPIQYGRIYIAPPDRHLLLEKGMVRLTRGPKENRFRPAVDPLFRSAAYEYGSQVIGVVLTGGLDDGTAGLWAIKARGGLAVVQDPEDAEVPSMPQNALQAVTVDYKVAIAGMGALLARLCCEPISDNESSVSMDQHIRTEAEVRIALQDKIQPQDVRLFGDLSPYTCPDCHGVLSALQEGGRVRFRCHTGHAFSADTLLTTITDNIEDNLWAAIRGVEESILLLNHMGDHFAESNDPKLAASYFKKAQEAGERVQLVRRSVLSHEQISPDSIRQDAAADEIHT